MRRLLRALAVIALVLLLVALGLRWTALRTPHLDDRTGPPALDASRLETVADLTHPPGNVAVSATGRVFVTLHPDGAPPEHVVEIADGKPVPFPDAAYQRETPGIPFFQTPLALRIDRAGRLWVLDHAAFGRGQPRILAFDVDSRALVHRFDFPADVAGFLSMLNDFQVSPDGGTIYIAETSPILQRPALIVYDVASQTARRVLDRHPSVQAEPYLLRAAGRDMLVFGVLPLRIGVDSIALDHDGTWLYYGPVNGDRLFRIATRDLLDESLAPATLGARVEDYGPKPLSDGLTMDVAGNVYITDPEHSAVLTLGPDRVLRTVVAAPQLRWPDGFSFGPDRWLYVTSSALQHVLFRTDAHMRRHAPYQVFRLQPGPAGIPGH